VADVHNQKSEQFDDPFGMLTDSRFVGIDARTLTCSRYDGAAGNSNNISQFLAPKRFFSRPLRRLRCSRDVSTKTVAFFPPASRLKLFDAGGTPEPLPAPDPCTLDLQRHNPYLAVTRL